MQQFDENGNCVRQDFTGDQVDWENTQGESVDIAELPDPEPSFPIELIQPEQAVDPMQPLPTGSVAMAVGPTPPEQPKPLTASAMSFDFGEQVEVVPLDNGYPPHEEFVGTVIGVKNGEYVMVKDADDNVFDCEPIQGHHLR